MEMIVLYISAFPFLLLIHQEAGLVESSCMWNIRHHETLRKGTSILCF